MVRNICHHHCHNKDELSKDRCPEAWSQGENDYNRHWFPIWDDPNNVFVYTVTIKASKGWKVMINSRIEMINHLVMGVAPYGVYGSERNGVWVSPGTPTVNVDAVMEYVPGMFKYFEKRPDVPYLWENDR